MNKYYEDMMDDVLGEYGIGKDGKLISENKTEMDEKQQSFSTETNVSKSKNTNMFSWLFGSVDEATLPGAEQTDDDDEITLGDAGADDTAGTDTQDTGGDDTAVDDTGEDTGDDEGEDENYNLPDAEDTGDEGDDADAGEEGGDEEGEGDYELPDAGEGDEGGDDETGDDVGGDDTTGGTDTDDGMDTADQIDGNGSGGDGVSDEVQIPNLRDVQQKLFDQLTEEQQKIKIENLKSNYSELYTRCANILKILTDSNPGDENTARVFDYVQKTMTDLQTHVYYYITNTFDTKTYIENDTQFKQFLVILNTIKNILDEINVEKKE